MAASDLQRTQHTQDAPGTVAAALAITDVDLRQVLIAGLTTVQTTTALEALQVEVDGKRTPSLWTPRPWAITTVRMQSM